VFSQLIGKYLDFEIEYMTETEHNFKLNYSYIAFYPIILIIMVVSRIAVRTLIIYNFIKKKY